MKLIAMSLATILALPLPAVAEKALPAPYVSKDDIRHFIEGRDDAFLHTLSFSNIVLDRQGIPGMPTSQFYRRKNKKQQFYYVSGAIFAYSHLSSALKRDDLIECYNSYYGPGSRILDYVYENDSSIASRNVASVLLNFCVSTNELNYMVKRHFQ